MNKDCLDFIEEFTGTQPLSSDARDHLAQCPGCQGIAADAGKLRSQASAFPDAAPPALRQKVLTRLAPPPAPAPFWQAWFQPLFVTAAALVLLFVVFTQPGSPPAAGPGGAWEVSIDGRPRQAFLPDRPFQVASGSEALIAMPDGSELLARGPAALHARNRSFHLSVGIVQARVKPGNESFIATTPHGSVEVVGTVFTLKTASEGTSVEVTEGKVLVRFHGTPPSLLTAGQIAASPLQTAVPASLPAQNLKDPDN